MSDKQTKPAPSAIAAPSAKPLLANDGLLPEDKSYFCDVPPREYAPATKVVEDFWNWARAQSLWVLGFGTGCGAIELRPLMTSRFDMYRYGIQPRPTPRRSPGRRPASRWKMRSVRPSGCNHGP